MTVEGGSMKKDQWYARGSGRKKTNPKVQSEEQGGRDLFDTSKIGRATRSAAPSVPRNQSVVSASDVLNSAASHERNTGRTTQDDGGERGRGVREAGRGGGGGARGGGAGGGGGGGGEAARAGTSRAALAAGSRGSQSRAADSSHHNHADEPIEIQSEEDISDEEAEPAWIDGDRGVLVASGGRVIYAPSYKIVHV